MNKERLMEVIRDGKPDLLAFGGVGHQSKLPSY